MLGADSVVVGSTIIFHRLRFRWTVGDRDEHCVWKWVSEGTGSTAVSECPFATSLPVRGLCSFEKGNSKAESSHLAKWRRLDLNRFLVPGLAGSSAAS